MQAVMIENLSNMVNVNQTVVAEPGFAPSYGLMITGAQIRAARALLGWSAQQLADKSGVSYSAIQRAESFNTVPSMRAPNLYALQRALEDGGVVFQAAGENRPGGDGVRLRGR
jgi:hypothetical protein